MSYQTGDDTVREMLTTEARLWDRLGPGERGSLVRRWKVFSEQLQKVGRIVESDLVAQAYSNAYFREDLAKARANYLFGIRDTWFHLAWDDKSLTSDPRFPAGGDLDGLLWEQHPSNLLDEIEAASKVVTKAICRRPVPVLLNGQPMTNCTTPHNRLTHWESECSRGYRCTNCGQDLVYARDSRGVPTGRFQHMTAVNGGR